MKAAVRYFTRSGNTKKLADAVGAATGAEVLDVSVDLSEKTELLFLGSSVYAGKFDASVGDFLDRNSDRIGTIVCFGSSASGKSTWKKIGNWAAENGVSVVTNPASNMKLGNGFAPVPEMVKEGINVCLGTDGAASNNAQNMFRELGLLALIHKGTHDTPQCVSADDAFRMATRNAAAALSLPTGSLEVGKKADIVLLDLDAPSLTPLNDAVSALAYSANGSEVADVIIDGAVVMRNRELLTVDEERMRFEIARICGRLGL